MTLGELAQARMRALAWISRPEPQTLSVAHVRYRSRSRCRLTGCNSGTTAFSPSRFSNVPMPRLSNVSLPRFSKITTSNSELPCLIT